VTVNFNANSKTRNWNCKIRVGRQRVEMTQHYDSRRSKKRLPKYQSTESGSLKMMHQHKILTYMSFVCLIVSEQEGEESGTHRGAKDGSRRKRPRDVEGDTKQCLGI
jgi:hypothetical protein